MSSKKRTQTKEAKKEGSDKRSRTDSYAAEVRESISLPTPVILTQGLRNIVTHLEKIQSANKEKSDYAYPVIIGSRAAAYWFPSFRACADWDIVATPQQAIDLIVYGWETEHLEMTLMKQPLDTNVVRRKPLPTDIKQKMTTIPPHLYKISGKNKEFGIKFEIEIAANEQESTELSSAGQILSICNSNPDAPLMSFSVGRSRCRKYIPASLELLETLKTSHIFWPAYFDKHIADLHALRTLLPPRSDASSSVNYGIRADETKPMTPPTRSVQLEHFLVTRTLEIEAIQGTPGAHINLNISNEDFLGCDDDLFATRHIPHDDVHDIVKYGDAPIYDQLKTDKSKAMVSRDLFEKAPYEKQIQCVKEEAMVISLERFLLPKSTFDPAAAYRSALIQICTTLTKGWFCQFAVDNFPRLAVCDKDLITIRDAILWKHPWPIKLRNETLELLKETITSLEVLHTMEQLISLTKYLSKGIRIVAIADDTDEPDSDEPERDEPDSDEYNSDGELTSKYDRRFWTISSTKPDQPKLLVSFLNESRVIKSNRIPRYYFHATLSVQPMNDRADKHLSAYKCNRDGFSYLRRRGFHKAAAKVSACNKGDSWVEDKWADYDFKVNPLKDEVEMLGVEGLTEDLLMAYLLAVVQPKLFSNGETPFHNHINSCKSKGLIPVSPKNHLWFNCWKYNKFMH